MRLIEANQGILHNVCGLYCHDPTDRQDLFQEIVIQLWKAFPSFRQESKPSTWLYQVALNVAISNFRRVSRRPAQTTLSDEVLNYAAPTDERSTARLEHLYRAIGTLSDVDKALVMLHFEEKSSEEIAVILGITPGNVRVKMHRVQEKLRQRLKSHS